MDLIETLVVPIIFGLVLIVALLTGFAYLSYFERKLAARFTMRFGPNRAGPWGLLQPAADALKMMFKEEIIPKHVDRVVYLLAPMLAVATVLVVWAVVPIFSRPFILFGYVVPQALADVNVALLFILGITSLGAYGTVLAGWSSNNKYALLGGLRTSAQIISYELPLSVALVSVLLVTGSLSLIKTVEYQVDHVWLILVQPVAFLIFFISSLAEAGRSPFDQPEAENELVSGFMTEYGGIKFALFFMGEYIHVITLSALGASLFLGGWDGPLADPFPVLGLVYFVIKISLIIFLVIWVRASIPRVRFDHLMQFCWKFLLPLSLLNLVVTAVVIVLIG
jgi:NADH-quinone oxidoreductase subunit H